MPHYDHLNHQPPPIPPLPPGSDMNAQVSWLRALLNQRLHYKQPRPTTAPPADGFRQTVSELYRQVEPGLIANGLTGWRVVVDDLRAKTRTRRSDVSDKVQAHLSALEVVSELEHDGFEVFRTHGEIGGDLWSAFDQHGNHRVVRLESVWN